MARRAKESVKSNLDRTSVVFSILVTAATIAANWIIPWRLSSYPIGSYFTFGYIGDEYTYAQRMQPLIAGTSASNTINSSFDPGFISIYFLEDLCRALLSATGINVITFFWIWRIAFPLVLAVSLAVLIYNCSPLPQKLSGWFTVLIASIILPSMYVLYEVIVSYPPLHGWLDRIPTNIEFPLSCAIAACYIRLLRNPTWRNQMLLSLAMAVTAYLRFYTILPWGICCGLGVSFLTIRKRIKEKTILIGFSVFLLAMVPLVLIFHLNAKSPIQHDMMERYFGPRAWRLHVNWIRLSAVSVSLLAFCFFVSGRARIFFASAAAALELSLFLPNLFRFSREMLEYDRFSCFYLICIAVGISISAGHCFRRSLRSDSALIYSAKTRVLPALGLLCVIVIARENLSYDLLKYPYGPLPAISKRLDALVAFQWVEKNTPADAVFLVDDGIDWSNFVTGEDATVATKARSDGSVDLSDNLWRRIADSSLDPSEDIFQIVARRQCMYASRLYGTAISADALALRIMLHRATFGLPLKPESYFQAGLQTFKPTFIFWTKSPGPRGYGKRFNSCKQVVYKDDSCEIWKIDPTVSPLPP